MGGSVLSQILEAGTLHPSPAIRQAAHHNIDPFTGRCLDCGVTCEEIDDNLAPTCVKIEGPNRLALLELNRRLRYMDRLIESRRRQRESAERIATICSGEIGEAEAMRAELLASMESLKQ